MLTRDPSEKDLSELPHTEDALVPRLTAESDASAVPSANPAAETATASSTDWWLIGEPTAGEVGAAEPATLPALGSVLMLRWLGKTTMGWDTGE